MRYLESDDSIFAESTLAINARCWRRYGSGTRARASPAPRAGAHARGGPRRARRRGCGRVGAEQAAVEGRCGRAGWPGSSSLSSAWNQRPTGTPKPILRRVLIGLGKRSAKARLSTTFDRPGRNLSLRSSGIAAASSTTRWSRNGPRHSRLCAMLAMSTLSKRSPGKIRQHVAHHGSGHRVSAAGHGAGLAEHVTPDRPRPARAEARPSWPGRSS